MQLGSCLNYQIFNFHSTLHYCYFCFSDVLLRHLVNSGLSTALSKLSSKKSVTNINDVITRLTSVLDSG
jgi:hypothetical protein